MNRLIQMARRLAPSQSVATEVAGFTLVAIGAFGLMSLLTYHLPGAEGAPVSHPGGPVGGFIASVMLRLLGLVSLLWVVLPVVWGMLMILGFIRRPAARRLAAAALLTLVLCGLMHVRSWSVSFLDEPAGPGGVLGRVLGDWLRHSVGRGGAYIVFAAAAAASLALTGNMSFSRTSELLQGMGRRGTKLLGRTTKSANGGRGRATAQRTNHVGIDEGLLYEEGDESCSEPARAAAEDGPTEVVASVDFSSSTPRHSRPDPRMFRAAVITKQRKGEHERIAALLESQLREFKVEGKISGITEGPVVTTIQFEPAPGTKASKIVALGEDLARLLSAESLRVLAPIPGRNTVGFEVPNTARRTIPFGNVLKDFRKIAREMTLPIVLGVDTFGNTVVEDLVEMPHLLVAGATGSGKSVFINTLVASLVSRNTAKELRFVMIDPKMVELAPFNDLPHMACPVVTDIERDGMPILEHLVAEMEDRYRRLSAVGARNIAAFNEIIARRSPARQKKFDWKWQPMPRVVFLVDEFADMIAMLGKDAEMAVGRLAQKARASGVHLVIATQRPSVNVVTGVIKANFPTRVAFRVLSGVDSRTILDQIGAERLLGRGDMLFQSARGLRRLHAPFLDDRELNRLVKACA